MIALAAARANGRLIALGALVAYFMLVGGTTVGDFGTQIRALNAVLGALVVLLWIAGLPKRLDVIDIGVACALAAFLLASIASPYPRLSFEPAVAGMAYAAAFSLARRELASPAARSMLLAVFAITGAVVSLVVLSLWLPRLAEWTALTGNPPPLDLRLPSGPYRHQHIAAMLIALTLPALLSLATHRRFRPLVLTGVILAASAVAVSTSRTVWLSLAVTGGLAFLLGIRLRRHHLVVGLVLLALGALGIAFSGAWAGLADRLSSISTIASRIEIWVAALDIWASHPGSGTGPGTFPAALMSTDYFRELVPPPRHAHNALVQLVAEAGVVGVLGVGALSVTMLWSLRAGRRHPFHTVAVVGLLSFLLMSAMENPSDTANVTVIGILWAAMLFPESTGDRDVRGSKVVWRAPAVAAAALVSLGIAMTATASAAFDDARRAAADGNTDRAIDALTTAIRADPQFALYWRERGVRRLEIGATDPGLQDLDHAVVLNPADPAAHRAAALGHLAAGDTNVALALARTAMDLRPTDPTNALTYAQVADAVESSDPEVGLRLAISASPWITAAPEWSDQFPTGEELRTLLKRTSAAWNPGGLSLERTRVQTEWLRAIAADPRVTGLHAAPDILALAAVLRCDLDTDDQTLLLTRQTSVAALLARAMAASIAGDADELATASRLLDLWRVVTPGIAETDPGPASPFSDPAGDLRVYERSPMAAPEIQTLPATDQGLAAWLRNPPEAAARGAPGSDMAECIHDAG